MMKVKGGPLNGSTIPAKGVFLVMSLVTMQKNKAVLKYGLYEKKNGVWVFVKKKKR